MAEIIGKKPHLSMHKARDAAASFVLTQLGQTRFILLGNHVKELVSDPRCIWHFAPPTTVGPRTRSSTNSCECSPAGTQPRSGFCECSFHTFATALTADYLANLPVSIALVLVDEGSRLTSFAFDWALHGFPVFTIDFMIRDTIITRPFNAALYRIPGRPYGLFYQMDVTEDKRFEQAGYDVNMIGFEPATAPGLNGVSTPSRVVYSASIPDTRYIAKFDVRREFTVEQACMRVCRLTLAVTSTCSTTVPAKLCNLRDYGLQVIALPVLKTVHDTIKHHIHSTHSSEQSRRADIVISAISHSTIGKAHTEILDIILSGNTLTYDSPTCAIKEVPNFDAWVGIVLCDAEKPMYKPGLRGAIVGWKQQLSRSFGKDTGSALVVKGCSVVFMIGVGSIAAILLDFHPALGAIVGGVVSTTEFKKSGLTAALAITALTGAGKALRPGSLIGSASTSASILTNVLFSPIAEESIHATVRRVLLVLLDRHEIRNKTTFPKLRKLIDSTVITRTLVAAIESALTGSALPFVSQVMVAAIRRTLLKLCPEKWKRKEGFTFCVSVIAHVFFNGLVIITGTLPMASLSLGTIGAIVLSLLVGFTSVAGYFLTRQRAKEVPKVVSARPATEYQPGLDLLAEGVVEAERTDGTRFVIECPTADEVNPLRAIIDDQISNGIDHQLAVDALIEQQRKAGHVTIFHKVVNDPNIEFTFYGTTAANITGALIGRWAQETPEFKSNVFAPIYATLVDATHEDMSWAFAGVDFTDVEATVEFLKKQFDGQRASLRIKAFQSSEVFRKFEPVTTASVFIKYESYLTKLIYVDPVTGVLVIFEDTKKPRAIINISAENTALVCELTNRLGYCILANTASYISKRVLFTTSYGTTADDMGAVVYKRLNEMGYIEEFFHRRYQNGKDLIKAIADNGLTATSGDDGFKAIKTHDTGFIKSVLADLKAVGALLGRKWTPTVSTRLSKVDYNNCIFVHAFVNGEPTYVCALKPFRALVKFVVIAQDTSDKDHCLRAVYAKLDQFRSAARATPVLRDFVAAFWEKFSALKGRFPGKAAQDRDIDYQVFLDPDTTIVTSPQTEHQMMSDRYNFTVADSVECARQATLFGAAYAEWFVSQQQSVDDLRMFSFTFSPLLLKGADIDGPYTELAARWLAVDHTQAIATYSNTNCVATNFEEPTLRYLNEAIPFALPQVLTPNGQFKNATNVLMLVNQHPAASTLVISGSYPGNGIIENLLNLFRDAKRKESFQVYMVDPRNIKTEDEAHRLCAKATLNVHYIKASFEDFLPAFTNALTADIANKGAFPPILFYDDCFDDQADYNTAIQVPFEHLKQWKLLCDACNVTSHCIIKMRDAAEIPATAFPYYQHDTCFLPLFRNPTSTELYYCFDTRNPLNRELSNNFETASCLANALGVLLPETPVSAFRFAYKSNSEMVYSMMADYIGIPQPANSDNKASQLYRALKQLKLRRTPVSDRRDEFVYYVVDSSAYESSYTVTGFPIYGRLYRICPPVESAYNSMYQVKIEKDIKTHIPGVEGHVSARLVGKMPSGAADTYLRNSVVNAAELLVADLHVYAQVYRRIYQARAVDQQILGTPIDDTVFIKQDDLIHDFLMHFDARVACNCKVCAVFIEAHCAANGDAVKQN